MPIPSLFNTYIDETYQRLVQTTGSGTEFADGLGNPITFGTTNTGSLLLTASVASNIITFTKGDGTTFPITVNTGSGGGGATFPYTGSAIITGSLIVTGSTTSTLGFTGSLFGTSSWATSARTASYSTTLGASLTSPTSNQVSLRSSTGAALSTVTVNNVANATTAVTATTAATSSYPITLNGNSLISAYPPAGVAGSGIYSIFLGLNAGNSATSADFSNFIGITAGFGAYGASYSNFLGYNAGAYAIYGSSANFLGYEAGYNAPYTDSSNFIGFQAGFSASFAQNSNFIGVQAGRYATYAYNSNFIGAAGTNASSASDSNFIGNSTGNDATNAYYSNFIGNSAGNSATNAYYSNFIGANAGNGAISASYSTLIGFNTGFNKFEGNIGSNNIIIGTNISLKGGRKDSINIGAILFGTGSYSSTASADLGAYTGSAGGKIGINQPFPTFNFEVSGSVGFPNLTNSTQTNVVSIDTVTGQLFYQAAGAGGSGSVFPYTGSAGINGDLSVHNTTGTTVASFEGTNGFPIQIITTSGSLTAGYTADLGSIGNGNGTLYLKTGSSDPDWAPIAYDNHLVQQTYTGIDMSIGDYTIPGPGIYEITVGSNTYNLIFPDPTSFVGQKITIIDADITATVGIDNTNTFAPYNLGNSTQIGGFDYKNPIDAVSIGGKWRNLLN